MTTQADLRQLFSEATAHHQSGRLAEAEKLYRQVLAVDGRHADSLHLLGLIVFQQGRHDAAVELIGHAIRSRDGVAAYHSNLGTVLMQQGHLAAAQAQFERALALNPSYAEASYNLAVAFENQGRFDEAFQHYARAQALKPDYADTHYNQALVLQRQGRNEEAALLYKRTLALRPEYVDACNNLGVALENLGRRTEAAMQFRRALALDPANANACNNLASALQREGDLVGALAAARRALDLRDNVKTRRVLVECLKGVGLPQMTGDVRDLLRRALSEVWARPAELAPVVIGAIKSSPEIASYLGRAETPRFADLANLAEDSLVLCLLRSAPICDPELERLFTACRAAFLDEVGRAPSAAEFPEATLDLACALAEQCFINEYVFACSADEAGLVRDLEARVVAKLGQDEPVPLTWLVTLSAYRPLVSLPGVERLKAQGVER